MLEIEIRGLNKVTYLNIFLKNPYDVIIERKQTEGGNKTSKKEIGE